MTESIVLCLKKICNKFKKNKLDFYIFYMFIYIKESNYKLNYSQTYSLYLKFYSI